MPDNVQQNKAQTAEQQKAQTTVPAKGQSNQQGQGGMTRAQFNSELESLKRKYEEERQARMNLERMAESLSQTLQELREQVSQLQVENEYLQSQVYSMYSQ